MRIALTVQVWAGVDQLLENGFAGGFGQSLIRHLLYVMVNAGPLTQLHDQVHVGALVNHLVQFHYIWVPQVRKRIYFTMHCHLSLFYFQVFLIVRFEGNNVFGVFVGGSTHDRKSTLPNLQSNLEFFQVEGLLVRLLLSPPLNYFSKGAQALSISLFVRNYLEIFWVRLGPTYGSSSLFRDKRLVFGQLASLRNSSFTIYLTL